MFLLSHGRLTQSSPTDHIPLISYSQSSIHMSSLPINSLPNTYHLTLHDFMISSVDTALQTSD